MFGQRIGDKRYGHMLNGEEGRALLLKLLDLDKERDSALSQVEELKVALAELRGEFESISQCFIEDQNALVAAVGEPYSDLRLPAEGSWVRFIATAARAGEAYQVEEIIYDGKPWVVFVGARRTVGLVDPALLEPCAAPEPAPGGLEKRRDGYKQDMSRCECSAPERARDGRTCLNCGDYLPLSAAPIAEGRE